ncbi:MAG: hypothetical protein ACRD04_12435 [Terriglobales bacterium]
MTGELGLPDRDQVGMSAVLEAQGAAQILAAAPSNATPWYHNPCITSALGKGALEVGVDSIRTDP